MKRKEFICRECNGIGEIYDGNEYEGAIVEECPLCLGTGMEKEDLVYSE